MLYTPSNVTARCLTISNMCPLIGVSVMKLGGFCSTDPVLTVLSESLTF